MKKYRIIHGKWRNNNGNSKKITEIRKILAQIEEIDGNSKKKHRKSAKFEKESRKIGENRGNHGYSVKKHKNSEKSRKFGKIQENRKKIRTVV